MTTNANSAPAIENGASVFIPLNKLKKHRKNARKTPHSEASIEAKAASIAAKGILQNLVVEPELDGEGQPTGCYLVSIGEGRRLAQLLRVKRKQIKKTEPIRCVIDTANDPAEISLDENVTREDNQIERAYGQNNSILDNCHVRVSFATNDERTAKRVSDALGTATELRDSTNYAGHRLAPWLGHLMVSRQETARPLLTPGEIMQLPPSDEIVMVAGTPPIRATKARYFEDARLQERILTPPELSAAPLAPSPSTDDWSGRVAAAESHSTTSGNEAEGDPANAGIRREPELPEHEEIIPSPSPEQEFEFLDDEPDVDAAKARAMRQRMRMVARQVALNPDDGIDL